MEGLRVLQEAAGTSGRFLGVMSQGSLVAVQLLLGHGNRLLHEEYLPKNDELPLTGSTWTEGSALTRLSSVMSSASSCGFLNLG